MPINPRDEQLEDNDPTDELPILLETAVLDPAFVANALALGDSAELADSTGEHTLRMPTADTPDADAELATLKSDLEARAAQIEALEMDVRRLSARWLDGERHAAEKDALIEKLRAALEASRRELDERTAGEERLATELADRDAQLTAVQDELDRARATHAAQISEVDDLRRKHAALEVELAGLRAEREAERAKASTPVENRDNELREELASLTAYIANRASRWNELEAQATAATIRTRELERELEHRVDRQQAAEELARRETARAESLRRDLIELGRALEARDRELAALRAGDVEPLATDGEALRRQLEETRAELDQARADVARLERAVDGDRVLASRDDGLRQDEYPSEQSINAPALVCLTSDTPRQYTLDRSPMTIGRSSQCDIQIPTQFASREHARITIDRTRVLIEDLGSTNGVFVNSVRIDRHELHHSDLVTVGETQFRFVERMAH